jgi:glycerol-3-phosphate acyltransferase PlsY
MWGSVCALAGYIIGNIQASILISSVFIKKDIRKYGSGNAGSTNMLRVFGWKSAAATFLIDFAKGVGAAVLGFGIMGEAGCAIAGVAAILGHNYPALFGFRGGKGVATSYGVALVMFPLLAVGSGVATLLIALVTRYMSLGSILGLGVFCVGMFIFRFTSTPYVVAACIMFALVIFTHRGNLMRLFKGGENKLGLFQKGSVQQVDTDTQA